MTTTPPKKLWILFKSNDSSVVNHPTHVPTKDCDDVCDFIDAIKKKLSNQLGDIDASLITLHLTQDSTALEPNAALPAQNTMQTALIVSVPLPAAALESMAYGKAKMLFISECTDVAENQEVWENIPVDESISPCAELVELFKKNCSVFAFDSEASRRTVIDLFLREIVSQFPAFQVNCEYNMTLTNNFKKKRLNGQCDYTICHRGRPNDPHLVAIEAKMTMTNSMLQCIGECASIHYRRKKAEMPNRRVYGIHSTGNIWKFIFISQEGVVYVSGEMYLNVDRYVEESFNLIYRSVYYVIQQSFLNSARTTPNASTANIL